MYYGGRDHQTADQGCIWLFDRRSKSVRVWLGCKPALSSLWHKRAAAAAVCGLWRYISVRLPYNWMTTRHEGGRYKSLGIHCVWAGYNSLHLAQLTKMCTAADMLPFTTPRTIRWSNRPHGIPRVAYNMRFGFYILQNEGTMLYTFWQRLFIDFSSVITPATVTRFYTVSLNTEW